MDRINYLSEAVDDTLPMPEMATNILSDAMSESEFSKISSNFGHVSSFPGQRVHSSPLPLRFLVGFTFFCFL